MRNVDVLLEMVLQWKIKERRSRRCQLHARAKSPLDQGEIATGKVAIKIGNERTHRYARQRRNGGRIDAGTCNHGHHEAWDLAPCDRIGREDAVDQG